MAIPLVVGGIAVLDTHPEIAYLMFVVAAIAFVWGIQPLFRKRPKKPVSRKVARQKTLPTINYEKIDSVTLEDKKSIELMGIRMISAHGHMDLTGLLSDRASGVPLNELMTKACSLCGYPRNERGKRR